MNVCCVFLCMLGLYVFVTGCNCEPNNTSQQNSNEILINAPLDIISSFRLYSMKECRVHSIELRSLFKHTAFMSSNYATHPYSMTPEFRIGLFRGIFIQMSFYSASPIALRISKRMLSVICISGLVRKCWSVNIALFARNIQSTWMHAYRVAVIIYMSLHICYMAWSQAHRNANRPISCPEYRSTECDKEPKNRFISINAYSYRRYFL